MALNARGGNSAMQIAKAAELGEDASISNIGEALKAAAKKGKK